MAELNRLVMYLKEIRDLEYVRARTEKMIEQENQTYNNKCYELQNQIIAKQLIRLLKIFRYPIF